MKRLLLPSIFLVGLIASPALIGGCSSCDYQFSSHSYVFFQPQFHSASPELVSGFRHERVIAAEDGKHGAFQIALFGGKTTNSDDLATYLMPFSALTLTVGEQAAVSADDLTPNLYAPNFGIKTVSGTFLSKISMDPVQSTVGVGLNYRQSFWHNPEKGRGFWFEIIAPITHVKNTLNFYERVLDEGGGTAAPAGGMTFVGNMEEAFHQESWTAGKIDGSQTKTKLADMEVKLGYEWLDNAPCHLETYIGVLLPFGNTPNAEYLFEPVAGFGKHFGILFGSALGIEIWSSDDNERSLRVEQATHSQYLFSRTQTRSFDLKYKPWSRYLPVYENQQEAQQAATIGSVYLSTPGINMFTRELDVKPGYSLNTNTALVYYHKQYHMEVGYNFFARQAECLELACEWNKEVALQHVIGAGNTTTVRDITGNFYLTDIGNTHNTAIPLANYLQATIVEQDLDLNSAAVPSQLVNTVYGTLGKRWDNCRCPKFVDFGASYMFAHNNNATPCRWTIWGKAGISF